LKTINSAISTAEGKVGRMRGNRRWGVGGDPVYLLKGKGGWGGKRSRGACNLNQGIPECVDLNRGSKKGKNAEGDRT